MIFDNAIFSGLKDRFLESMKDVESDSFYLISKKWFDRNDKRVRQVEYDNFVYYFLIIWTEEINETLTVSEWTFDWLKIFKAKKIVLIGSMLILIGFSYFIFTWEMKVWKQNRQTAISIIES